ncbi:MAG: Na+/H+ antiporter NhaA, partial [Candidatus Sericytochromatia bacterium]|nr:Na+/H+ antiporter NhaA [Candidatus Sericytochromatia bacterium]
MYLHSPLGSGHARRLAAIAAAWAVTGDVVWLADRPQGAAGETVLLAPAWSGQGWPDSDAEARLARRGTQVATWLDEHPIDLLVLEYYPFGRRAYGPELAPVVAWAHGRHVPTVVSVRDVIGKPLGILGATWLATRPMLGGARLTVTWPALIGASASAGISFTVSLLAATLAFDGALLEQAKLGVLA